MKRLTAFVLVFAFILLLSGCKNDEDFLILAQSNDELSKPYENFLWSTSWEEDCWLCTDGIIMSHRFSEISSEIPQINYGEDFEIHYNDGVEFLSVSLYDANSYRRLIGCSTSYTPEEMLNSLHGTGTFYLVITVTSQGKYVASEKEYEYSGYECIYKVIIA